MTRQHPNGGYLLLVKPWGDFLAMRELAVEKDTDAGTVWEFIKIEY